MNNPKNAQQTDSDKNAHPMLDLIIGIIIPSIILMKFSSEEHLGSVNGLIVALSFPLGWGLFEFIRYRKFNFIALLGLISVLLTGGIGLLKLDVEWLAIKEAAIPAIIGLGVLISTKTPYPLIRTFIFNPKIFDVERIQTQLEKANSQDEFEKRINKATYWLAGTFLFSSTMNYLLAKWVVTSPTGSTAFNEELGRMTLLSYPVIAIPSMIMMMGIMYYLWRSIHGLTGLSLEEIMPALKEEKD